VSVSTSISPKPAIQASSNFSGRGSVLLWRRCDALFPVLLVTNYLYVIGSMSHIHIPTKSIFSRAHVREAAIDKLFTIPAKKSLKLSLELVQLMWNIFAAQYVFSRAKKRPVLKDRAKSKSQKLVNICDDEYKINKLQLDYRDSFWVPRWLGGQSRDSLCLRKGGSQERTIRYEMLF